MDTSNLVNWDPMSKTFARVGQGLYPEEDNKKWLANLSRKRHPVVEDYVQAWTEFWRNTGRSANCVKCFKGELVITHNEEGDKIKYPSSYPYYSKEQHGCCGSCSNLGKNGCLAKPIMCAMWSCMAGMHQGMSKESIVRLWTFVNTVRRLAWTAGLDHGPWEQGYARELDWTPTNEQLVVMKYSIHLLRGFQL